LGEAIDGEAAERFGLLGRGGCSSSDDSSSSFGSSTSIACADLAGVAFLVGVGRFPLLRVGERGTGTLSTEAVSGSETESSDDESASSNWNRLGFSFTFLEGVVRLEGDGTAFTRVTWSSVG